MKKTIGLLLALCLILALLPVGAAAASVMLSPQGLTVNGIPIECEKYNIDGSNYFKLRDIAYLLNGTENQFGVGYDNANHTVTVTSGIAYTPNGSELVIGEDKSATAVPSAQTILINGAENTGLSVYNLGGNNYFKPPTENTRVRRTAAFLLALPRSPSAIPWLLRMICSDTSCPRRGPAASRISALTRTR